ncbi:MAG: multi-sensor signal transduction histidine kinase [Thermoleophilia bacterium]|nr:multi-sensor signal transduction histidine kinase [Thermoleophilia bacterium]
MIGGIRTYVALVVTAAAAAIGASAYLAGAPTTTDLPRMAGFALAFLLVQLLPVPFPRGSQLELVRVEEAVVIPLVLLLDPAQALIAVALGLFAGQLFGPRIDTIKVAFNTAQLVVSVSAALLVTRAVAGSTSPGYGPLELGAAGAGLVAMFVANQLLVAGVLRVAAGTRMRSVLREDIGLKVGMWVANAALGTLLVLPAVQEPALLLVALVPLTMLHGAWRVHADHARDELRLRDLGNAVGGMSGEVPLEHVAKALAESARDVVDASGAEVRLYEHGHTYWARRTRTGVECGEHARGANDRGDASRVAFTVALTGTQGVLGELCVWQDRDADGVAPRGFGRRDRTLLEMLGHQAANALDNSLLAARTELQQRTITQVFDHSSEGMLVLDRRGRVRGWNPAMQALSGFSQGTIDASPISLISPQLAAIVGTNSPGTIDAVVSTADGDHRHVRASFAPIIERSSETSDSSDTEHSWVVVLRDVTLEQETERLKDDFVATVSHELRTPLTAIKGFLETMRRDDIELGAGQVRMFLQIMGEQADRLERLIGDLLDMSAIESGRPLQVDLTPVDVSTSVRRAITTFEAARPDATVTFADLPMGLVVDADTQRLEQVVTNLLDNALKHGGREGTIDVRIEQAQDGSCAIAVADHGPGISAVDQRRIFERFFVTSDSVTRTGGGAGLGLYICSRLISAMDGDIKVDSAVGEGTTFRVLLPVIAAAIPSDRVSRPVGLPQEATAQAPPAARYP